MKGRLPNSSGFRAAIDLGVEPIEVGFRGILRSHADVISFQYITIKIYLNGYNGKMYKIRHRAVAQKTQKGGSQDVV